MSAAERIVVKHGGSAMEDEAGNRRVAEALAELIQLGHRAAIVHGGGKAISRWMKRLGLEPQFIEGLRFTDAPGMEITEMVLSGALNPALVTHLNRAGVTAVGLSGKDAGMFTASRICSPSGTDLGFVGEVVAVHPELVSALLELGYTPVVSSVSSDSSGVTLNVNADYAAASLAQALGASRLIFITDVDGILLGGKTVPRLTLSEAEQLLTHPEIQGGMGPKLARSIDALRAGVGSVQMINGTVTSFSLRRCLGDDAPGTTITNQR